MSAAVRDRERFSPAQCRAGRALLRWSIEDLARRAQLQAEAVELYEDDEGGLAEGELAFVGLAFADAGVIAIRACHAGEGVRFSRPRPFAPGGWPLRQDDFDALPRHARAARVSALARQVGDTLALPPELRGPRGR